MKTSLSLVSALFACAVAGAAQAKTPPPPPIPSYHHVGSVSTTSYTFEAIASGDIDAYFLGGSADYTEVIGILINGVAPLDPITHKPITGLANHGTAVGTELDLGKAKAGDLITFYINVIAPTKLTWYSTPSLNSDGVNHTYTTAFDGGKYNKVVIPKGLYVAFEDLPKKKSDFDYNDAFYDITNVRAIPEPASIALMLGGLALLGAMARRRH